MATHVRILRELKARKRAFGFETTYVKADPALLRAFADMLDELKWVDPDAVVDTKDNPLYFNVYTNNESLAASLRLKYCD